MPRPSHHLPVWAQLLLERLLPYRDRAAVIGDFAEIYAAISREEGAGSARWWYLRQVLRSIPWFVINGLPMGGNMFRNYLKIASRNLRKRKFYSALNVGGLAIGMAICLLIFQYVAFESGYDGFHERADDLYRINLRTFRGEELTSQDPFSYSAMAPLLEESLPELEAITRLHPSYGEATIRTADRDMFKTSELVFVDPSFVDVFTVQALQGDPATALADPGSVVITRSAAERFFGTGPALGQPLDVFSWTEGTFTVRAVIEDVPPNSHLRMELLVPLEALLADQDGQYAGTDGWSWTNFVTYAVLRPGSDPAAAAERVDAALLSARAEEWEASGRVTRSEFQPVTRIHLHNEFDDGFATPAGYRTVLFVSVIGVFVLLIAWLNYVNLSTARAMERAREVGIRKASGARRTQVASQFVIESLLVNAIALLVAVVAADRALPLLNRIADVEIGRGVWQSGRLWLMLIACFGAGGLLASLYPAVVLSAFQPARILKGINLTRAGGARLRKSLVVFQFAISITLLSGTLIVFQQMNHLRGVDLGFDLEQVLVVERPGVIEDGAAYSLARDAFKADLALLAAVTEVTSSTSIPGNGYNLGTTAHREGAPAEDAEPVNVFWVADGFLDTWSIELVAGRALSSTREADREAVVLNETAVRVFGFSSPEDAVGARVVLGRSSSLEVVGVTTDYSWMSAKAAHSPLLMMQTRGGGFFSMRVATGEIEATLAAVEGLYHTHFPDNPFEFAFADDRFDRLYRAEERLARLVSVFAGFALVVAMLGLVGLSALTAAQRRKEISVRKVLGASELGISRLLTSHFGVLVGIGLALAIPFTWFFADRWLETFASRVAITPAVFLLPAAIVLLAALGASAFHVWRAAVSSPIAGIRAE